MKKHIKIAITGGIGSGKSLALEIIGDLGYNTVSFDKVYQTLLENEEFVLLISNEIGVSPIIDNGKLYLDRKGIAKKVFGNKEMLDKLNSITHGKIFEKAFSIYNEGIVFYEVPLLFEGGYQNLFDKVFVITKDFNERVNMVIKRDGVAKDEVIKKIQNQVDYEKIDLSLHTIIENNSTVEELKNNIVRAIKNIEENT